MVVVPVVNRELVHLGVGERVPAAAADPRIQFQSLTAVALLALILGASCVGDDLIEASVVGAIFLSSSHDAFLRLRGVLQGESWIDREVTCRGYRTGSRAAGDGHRRRIGL